MSTMKKLIILAEGLILACGMFTLSACFNGNPDPGYGYGYAPRYGYNSPAVVGDYDEHHVWHERDWWVSNRHDWVEHHHPEWDNNNKYHRG